MSTHLWQVQEAKSRFSELMDEALHHGPQIITRHGKKAVVVMAFEEHQQQKAKRKSLSQLFQDAPLGGTTLDLTRDRSLPRPALEL